jgi:hypothetical protein
MGCMNPAKLPGRKSKKEPTNGYLKGGKLRRKVKK